MNGKFETLSDQSSTGIDLLGYSSEAVQFPVNSANISLKPMFSIANFTSFSIDPPLPKGLSLDTKTAVISGTPIAALKETLFIITGIGPITQSFGIRIAITSIPVTFSYSTKDVITVVGSLITPLTPSGVSGAPTSYFISPELPSGLTMDTTTGIISGTPKMIQRNTKYTVSASNKTGGILDVSLNLVVNPIPVSFSYGVSTATLTANTAMANLSPVKVTGSPSAFSVSPILPSGLILNPITGVISGTPTLVQASSLYKVTGTNPSGGSLNVEIYLSVEQIPVTISYSSSLISVTAGSLISPLSPVGVSGAPSVFSIVPTLPSGMAFNLTSGEISGTPNLTQTKSKYTVTAKNASGGTGSFVINIEVNKVPVSFSYSSTEIVTNLSSDITSTAPTSVIGSPNSYTASPSLPAGISLSSSTGIISGAPSSLQSRTKYTITGTNVSGGSNSVEIFITVNKIPVAFSYSGSEFSVAANSVFTNQSPIGVSGAPSSFTSVPSLPAGITINSSTGLISGTPTLVQSRTKYTISGSNPSGGKASFEIFIEVIKIPVDFSYGSTTTVSAFVTLPIKDLTPVISKGPIDSYAIDPTLPLGLVINTKTGVISGTPTKISTSSLYTVTATNSSGGASTTTLTISVSVIPVSFSYSTTSVSANAGSVIVPLSLTSVSGMPNHFTIAPALPTGIIINVGTGEISGSATKTNIKTKYTVTGSNSSGGSYIFDIFFEITSVPVVFSYSSTQLSAILNSNIDSFAPVGVAGSPNSFSVSPALPVGLSLNSISGNISGTPSALQGNSKYIISASNPSGGSNSFELLISVSSIPVAFSYSASMISPIVSTRIPTLTLVGISGSPNRFSISPILPAGIILDEETGIISGIAKTIQTKTKYTITGSNTSGGKFSSDVSIEILGEPIDFWLSSSSVSVNVNTTFPAMTATITSGGPLVFSIAPSLPTGLSIDSSTGSIVGNPQIVSAAQSFLITGYNIASGLSKSVGITIEINSFKIIFSYFSTSAVLTRNQEISSFYLLKSGSTEASLYSISPSLPAGLSFDTSSGAISGKPTTISKWITYTITGVASPASWGSGSTTIELKTIEAPPKLSYPKSKLSLTYGTLVSISPTDAGGGEITKCISEPALPAGLVMQTNCVITGTPTEEVAEKSFFITAINDSGSDWAYLYLSVIRNESITGLAFAAKGSIERSFHGSDNLCAIKNGLVHCFDVPFFSSDTSYGGITGVTQIAMTLGAKEYDSSTGSAEQIVFALSGESVYFLNNKSGCSSLAFNYEGSPMPNLFSTTNPPPSTWCRVAGWGSGVKKISAGNEHICALMTSGGVQCIGSNYRGQLGLGGPDDKRQADSKSPVQVYGLYSGFKDISVNAFTSCALTTSGSIYCWGDNVSKQFGFESKTKCFTGVTMDSVICFYNVPVNLTPYIGNGWISMVTGVNDICAVRSDNTLFCTGENATGELGGSRMGIGNNCAPAIHECSKFDSRICVDYKSMCFGSGYVNGLSAGSVIALIDPKDTDGRFIGGYSFTSTVSTHCAIVATSLAQKSGILNCWGFNGEVADKDVPFDPNSFGNLGLPVDSNYVRLTDKFGKNGPLEDAGSSTPRTPLGGRQISRVAIASKGICAVESSSSGDQIWCWGFREGTKPAVVAPSTVYK